MRRLTCALAVAPIAAALLVSFRPVIAAVAERRVHDTPTRRVDIEKRVLRVRFDEAHRSVSGSITLSGSALDTLSSLALDAFELTVAAVQDSARGSLAFANDGEALTIRFPRTLARGDRLALTVDYSATPRAGLYWMLPDAAHPKRRAEVWSQGETMTNRCWFPDFDHPSERAATELYYTVPAGQLALGNGRLVETLAGPRPGEKTYHWREDFPFPSYLVMVAAGTFTVRDTVWGATPVQYYVPPDLVERVPRSVGRTPEMMEFFSRRFGVPYPYEKYAQVVVQDFTYGGMENLSATTMTDRLLIDPTIALERNQEGLVAHELAHQWFGDYVTCREWAHAWLNEGFATYGADLWAEHARGRDDLDRSLLEERAAYFASDRRARRPLVEPNYRWTPELFDAQTYQRGAWTLHMLRRKLGDDAFFRGLTLYLRHNAGSSVDSDALRLALEEASGAGLDGFFRQWVERAGYPELKVSWTWLEGQKLAKVVVEQTQASDSLTPVFRFDLPVRFALAGGDTRTVLAVSGRYQEALVPLAERPRYVEVNDDLSVLAKVSFERPVAELAAQLVGAPLAASRIEAARALGDLIGKAGALDALSKALREDRFYAARCAAAQALGLSPTPAALEALSAVLGDRDARVRRAATAAIGNLTGVPGAAAALRRMLDDPAYGPATQALVGLAKLEAPDARERLTRALARPAYGDSFKVAALAGIIEVGDPDLASRVEPLTRPGETLTVRAAACAALGALGARLPAEPAAGSARRERLRRALEALLWDERMQVRRAAADALGVFGDPASLDALERLMQRDPEERVLGTALEAQRKIRALRAASTGALKAELDRLEEKNRALEARLGALEEELKK